MMLAQANVLPTVPWSTTATVALGLLAILLIIGSLLWVWNQFSEARDRNSGKGKALTILPNPLVTQPHVEFTPLQTFNNHAAAVAQELKERAKQRDEDLRNAALARRDMHKEIQSVGKDVTALTTTAELQAKQLEKLDDKMDANRRELNDKLDNQLPETIATLVNAKKV